VLVDYLLGPELECYVQRETGNSAGESGEDNDAAKHHGSEDSALQELENEERPSNRT
jgi:hypothetical protein